ncbi:uncharacterized protein L201_004881 [Kwoniella dendrophila CBS 6074]|uniref:Uncharacterized protein n=1 Tax=Kwoniella dendrophila CBS 6074 TaxID=1295534 RepID=A0AAX4JZ15_9TREE
MSSNPVSAISPGSRNNHNRISASSLWLSRAESVMKVLNGSLNEEEDSIEFLRSRGYGNPSEFDMKKILYIKHNKEYLQGLSEQLEDDMNLLRLFSDITVEKDYIDHEGDNQQCHRHKNINLNDPSGSQEELKRRVIINNELFSDFSSNGSIYQIINNEPNLKPTLVSHEMESSSIKSIIHENILTCRRTEELKNQYKKVHDELFDFYSETRTETETNSKIKFVYDKMTILSKALDSSDWIIRYYPKKLSELRNFLDVHTKLDDSMFRSSVKKV